MTEDEMKGIMINIQKMLARQEKMLTCFFQRMEHQIIGNEDQRSSKNRDDGIKAWRFEIRQVQLNLSLHNW